VAPHLENMKHKQSIKIWKDT